MLVCVPLASDLELSIQMHAVYLEDDPRGAGKQEKKEKRANKERMCYQASFFCGWLKPNPTGELWDTVRSLPQGYPNRGARKL